MGRLHLGEDGRPHIAPFSGCLPFHDESCLPLAKLDVLAHLGMCPLIDHGPHVVTRLLRRADPEAHDGIGEPLEELVINSLVDDRT